MRSGKPELEQGSAAPQSTNSLGLFKEATANWEKIARQTQNSRRHQSRSHVQLGSGVPGDGVSGPAAGLSLRGRKLAGERAANSSTGWVGGAIGPEAARRPGDPVHAKPAIRRAEMEGQRGAEQAGRPPLEQPTNQHASWSVAMLAGECPAGGPSEKAAE